MPHRTSLPHAGWERAGQHLLSQWKEEPCLTEWRWKANNEAFVSATTMKENMIGKPVSAKNMNSSTLPCIKGHKTDNEWIKKKKCIQLHALWRIQNDTLKKEHESPIKRNWSDATRTETVCWYSQCFIYP